MNAPPACPRDLSQFGRVIRRTWQQLPHRRLERQLIVDDHVREKRGRERLGD
jgi:hypothetical protein